VRSATILSLFFVLQLFAAGQNSVTSYYNPVTKIIPVEKRIFHKVGESTVPLKILQYGSSSTPLVFVNLHDNEFTSVKGTKPILEVKGGLFIQIENRRQRNIRFRLRGKNYVVDPNRIFTKEGIAISLRENGPVSALAIEEVYRLGQRILELIPAEASCVFALHNNFNKDFSILSYLPGAGREKDALKVNVDSLQDPDDLILTTDSVFFEQIAAKGYNVILQDNINVKKDGSLSVHFGEKGKPYINLETEHGKTRQYYEMMDFLYSLAGNPPLPKPEYNSYRCILPGRAAEGSEQLVFFGEKNIGYLKITGYNAENGTSSGQLFIKLDFPAGTNSEFFATNNAAGQPGIELRIDPTKERLDIPVSTLIEIKSLR
jgi:hypothetical protein